MGSEVTIELLSCESAIRRKRLYFGRLDHSHVGYGSVQTRQPSLADVQRQLEDLKLQTLQLETALRDWPAVPTRLPVTKAASQTEGNPIPPLNSEQQNTTPRVDAPATLADSTDAAQATADKELEPPVVEQLRISELERSLQEFKGESQNFVESLSSESNRTVNGRIHLDHWGFPQDSPGINTIETGSPSDDPQDRFLNRRIRIGIRGAVPPANVSYRAEIEYSGQTGGRIRDAWLGWDDLVFFNTLRLGNQKRPYSLDQLNSSNFNVFLERPFAAEAFNSDSRRLGLMSYGESNDLQFNWQYGVFCLTPIQETNQILGDNYQPELAGRLAQTWWYDDASDGRGYGHVGIAGSIAFPDGFAPNNGNQNNQSQFQSRPEARSTNPWLDTGQIRGADTQELLALETVFNAGPIQITSEFMNSWVQRVPTAGNDLHFAGGYLYVSYFITGEHIPWDRSLGIIGRVDPLEDFFCVEDCNRHRSHGIGAWQVAVRYSYTDLNSEDIFGGIGESVTLGLNWYWNSHTRMQFNYIWGQIDDRLATLASGGTAIVSGDYQITGVRFMIDF